LRAEDFPGFVKTHWRSVFNFAYRVTNSLKLAEEIFMQIFERAYAEYDEIYLSDDEEMPAGLLTIAVRVFSETPTASELTFEELDDIIRTDPARILTTPQPTETERNYYLWELHQCCMTAVLSCLSPGERLGFILNSIMKCNCVSIASILGITEAAVKVRLSRATKKISDYLIPRCGHINPENPCRCSSRLEVAMSKGFIQVLPEAQLRDRRVGQKPFEEGSLYRDVVSLYGGLPVPEPSRDLVEKVLEEWARRDWKKSRKKE